MASARQPLASDKVVAAVAEALDQALCRPQRCQGPVTVFEADPQHPPQISVEEYLSRWSHHSGAGAEAIVLALMYIQRSGVVLNALTVHRLLLAALVLAAKYRNDEFFTNTFYGVVGGVSVEEVNRLEVALLEKVDWTLGVTSSEFDTMCAKLLSKNKESPVLMQSSTPSDSEDEGISSVDSFESIQTTTVASASDFKVSPAIAPRGTFDCIRDASALIWRLCGVQR